MRSIKIADDEPQSKVIEVPKSTEDYDSVSLRSEKIKKQERKHDDYSHVKKDKKYQAMFNFPSKYHYFVFLIMFQNSNEMIPVAVRHSLTFSGGGFLLQLIAVGVLIVFPLMYVEMFLGSYAQKTNSQIYKMAPIFFGLTFSIWIFTVIVLVIPTIEEAMVLAHFFKRISFTENYNLSCPDSGDTCYNFQVQPSLKDVDCKYNYISMYCEGKGEIRYVSEYHYWNAYKRMDNKEFPRWEMVVAIITEWILITFSLTRGLSTLVKMHNFGFIFKTIVFTVILITVLTKKGSGEGIHRVFYVSTEHMSIYEALGMLAFVMYRSGLIFPVGYMTYSSCLPQRKTMRGESVIICTFGLLLTIFYLMIVFGIMGVISHKMGVDLSATYVPFRGIFLATIPEFLLYYNNATVFAICYYFSLIFPETIRYAIHIHMWILNLYDFIPRYRKNHTHVCVIVCGFFCLLNMIGLFKTFHTIIIPAFYSVHTTIGTIIYLALQMTMICYVYGVNRLIDDIHFLVGYKPNKAGQYVWAIFPVILYVITAAFFFLRIRNETLSIENDLPPDGKADKAVFVLNIVQLVMLAIVVLLSISYVLTKIGNENTVLSFFKPHYLWGPEQRSERTKRKRFTPRKAIRSQRAPMSVTNMQEKQEKQFAPTPKTEEQNEHKEQILRSRIFSDSKFFQLIGISPHKVNSWTHSLATEKITDLKEEVD